MASLMTTTNLTLLEKEASDRGLLLRIQVRRPLNIWSIRLVVGEITSKDKIQLWGERNKPAFTWNLFSTKHRDHWRKVKELKILSENEIRAKWADGNPYINKNSLNNERVDILSNDSVNNENTVIINKTVIEKQYIPVK